MARPLRIEIPGAVYHVTSRGDRRNLIYEDDRDRIAFLQILARAVERFSWLVHAYCLMGNHYHLLIETPEANLSKGMRHLNGVYTQAGNCRHQRVGHLFQGRYKAILVQKHVHLLELCRYIVLNPVRAQMVQQAGNWPWSNYRATAGELCAPEWLATDWTLSGLGDGQRPNKNSTQLARQAYRQFVATGRGQPSPWAALKNQIFLGDDRFVARMHAQATSGGVPVSSEVPKKQRLRRVVLALSEYQKRALSRDDAIVAAYASGGYSQKEIGEHFGLHYSRVSRIVNQAKDKT